MSRIRYTNVTTPSTPPSGQTEMFVDSADKKAKIIDDAGTVTDLTAGAAGGDSITVNTSAATDADFDDASPAAPAGDLNVKWQITGASPSDVSAYVDVSVLEPLVSTNNLVFDGLTAAADRTIDLTGAATRTLTLQNSTGSQQANLDVDGVLIWRNNHATGTFTFAGTPTAARTITWQDATGTVALHEDNLSVFAATTSAQLAGVISDETGTGALVFANSPTLVTPALGTPASGVLTNCTGYPGDSSLVTVGTITSGTWNGTAIEGTAIASTGEAGGTKFLREDGDGTCSWQTVAGGSGNTLDQAYDQGGAGAGRSITADSGAVQMLGTALGGDDLLDVDHTASGTLTANTTNVAAIDSSRTHTAATTLTDNFDNLTITRTSVVNNASATLTVQGALVKLTSVGTETSGTLTQEELLLELVHEANATGPAINYQLSTDSGLRFRVTQAGGVQLGDGAGATVALTTNGAGILDVANIVDANTGFRIAGAATSGNVLRGDGTNFVSATLAAGDLSDGVPNTRTITVAGDANEITVAEGAQDLSANRTFTVGIADAPTIPGDYMTVPTKADPDPTGANGRLFYNTTDSRLRYAESTTWRDVVFAGGAFHDGFSDFVANEHIDHSSVTITVAGDANEITVAEGAQDLTASRTFTVGIADNPTIPGDYITVPVKADPDPTGANGRLFFNSTDDQLRYASSTTWRDLLYSGGALGTPSGGTLTNATGLPISTGVSGLGTGVATFLGTPSSANLASAVTDETGSGALVFGTSPTLTGATLNGVQDAGGATSFEIPNGAGGTTIDAAGEMCVDTTSKTLNFHDGTAETVLNPEQSKSISVEDPTASEDISIFFTNKAITVTEMRAVLLGSATPSVTWTIRHGTDRNAAGAEVVTSGTTTTSTTTGSDVTSFNDATVVADSFVWLETTAQSGTVDEINITIFYTVDA